MPDPIGIVRCRGYCVVAGAEGAGESECDGEFVVFVNWTQFHIFQFGVGAVNIEADAGADHNADDRVRYRGVEADGDGNGGGFSTVEYRRIKGE